MVSFLIDAVLAATLVTATVFLVIVNKRLKLLRSGQSEINALVGAFTRSIDETDASMKRLVGSATETASRLAEELDRAKTVKEETTLLLGSCERTAARIEESVQHARALVRRLEQGAMTRPRPRPPEAGEPPPAPVSTPVPTPAPAPAVPPAPAGAGMPDAAAGPAPRHPAADMAADMAADRAADRAAAEPERQTMAASAFYARLRTVGTGG